MDHFSWATPPHHRHWSIFNQVRRPGYYWLRERSLRTAGPISARPEPRCFLGNLLANHSRVSQPRSLRLSDQFGDLTLANHLSLAQQCKLSSGTILGQCFNQRTTSPLCCAIRSALYTGLEAKQSGGELISISWQSREEENCCATAIGPATGRSEICNPSNYQGEPSLKAKLLWCQKRMEITS